VNFIVNCRVARDRTKSGKGHESLVQNTARGFGGVGKSSAPATPTTRSASLRICCSHPQPLVGCLKPCPPQTISTLATCFEEGGGEQLVAHTDPHVLSLLLQPPGLPDSLPPYITSITSNHPLHHVRAAVSPRAGMDIPHGSISNASVWGAPVWVPAALLAAAAGVPSPDLMYHLRTTLDTIVNDPEGLLNKQVGVIDRECHGRKVGLGVANCDPVWPSV
jgi:hypothetical protein